VSLIRSLRRWWNNRNAGWTLAEEQVAGLENGRRKAPNEASDPSPSVKRGSCGDHHHRAGESSYVLWQPCADQLTLVSK
jgi:hypothetical protein